MKVGTYSALKATASVLALVALSGGAAQASGFINSSQSSVFNGTAYAGFAAPGSASAATMFMNPATMTGFNRLTFDTNYTFGVPTTKITGNSLAGLGTSSGDIGMDYFVPATYVIYPLNDKLFLGLSINSTYGNTTKPGANWTGSLGAATSKLRIITVTPSAAYKINEQWSVGVGFQLQYATARQYAYPGTPAAGAAGIAEAEGVGFGVTAGVTGKPTKTTQIGLGWRSFVDQNLEGTTVFLGGAQNTATKGTINLPNRVNLSLRQTLAPKFDLLASIEWQNWGRIGHAALTNPANAALAVVPYGYQDGWMFALGGEYRATEKLTLRAGMAYEISGVTDSVRRLSLPDNDRTWFSAGLSYEATERFTLNASYSYLHIKNAPITQTLAPFGTFTGTSKADAHLISIGLTSKWGAAPKKEEALVRKF